MRASGLRAPLLVLATLAAAGAAAAIGYALTAPHRYRATAQLIVSPVPATDQAFTGVDVLRDTGGKRTAAASAAALVRGPLVADAVRALLGLRRSRDSLLRAVGAHQVDGSDVVAVTVEDTSANGAARLANAFVDTLINQRSATFQSEAADAVRRYAHALSNLSAADRNGPTGREIARRLAELRPLQNGPDPSLAHAGQATAPTESVWPNVGELAAIGAGIGAGAGLLAAIALVLIRRPIGIGGRQYDPGMADERGLEQLVDRLERRLTARESALAARERDLRGALDEVRAAHAAAPDSADDLARREGELEHRIEILTTRELELARRAAELAAAEAPVAEREAAVAALAADLDRRAEAVERAERDLDERAAALQAREDDAAEAELAAQAPTPLPPPVRLPVPTSAEAGSYNLVTLERLVTERLPDFPGRAEEWQSYLYFLREYAGPDGSVPACFDWLIQDTFTELVS